MLPARKTSVQIHFTSAASMDALEDETVDLVVTSPPYPMIEMWDEIFARQNPAVGEHLARGRGAESYEAMHQQLDLVWAECQRVLRDGGLLCINVGDATRSLGGDFQLYPNHARIMTACSELGLKALPGILWRKSTNKPNKFMGSGMLPPNAYVTLEHEHVLLFRKGSKRQVERREARYQSAFFWEERNRWFSDVWTDLTGTAQVLAGEPSNLRDRSAAFPLLLPYRLIAMYSVAGDTVLDPFWGTGTTSIAAALLGRHSIGYELEEGFAEVFHETLPELPTLSRSVNRKRLCRHRRFLESRNRACNHHNARYDTPVVTRQEEQLTLYDVTATERAGKGCYRFHHAPHERAG